MFVSVLLPSNLIENKRPLYFITKCEIAIVKQHKQTANRIGFWHKSVTIYIEIRHYAINSQLRLFSFMLCVL